MRSVLQEGYAKGGEYANKRSQREETRTAEKWNPRFTGGCWSAVDLACHLRDISDYQWIENRRTRSQDATRGATERKATRNRAYDIFSRNWRSFNRIARQETHGERGEAAVAERKPRLHRECGIRSEVGQPKV
jgi:hypothetical protein